MIPRAVAVLARWALVICAVPVVVYVGVTGLLFGDAASFRTGGRASPQEVAQLRATLGLDVPWWEGVLRWSAAVLHGDPGISLLTSRPVGEVLDERWPTASALLVGTALVIVPLGGLLAWWVGTRSRSALIVATCVAALPVPVVAVVATVALVHQGGAVAAVSLVPAGDTLWQHPPLVVLPALTLGVPSAGWVGVLLGGVLGDVRALPHVRDARIRAVGLPAMVLREVGPFVVAPVLRVAAVLLGVLLFSSTAVETLFAVNGFGELAAGAIGGRDVPVVLAVAAMTALVMTVGLAAADLVGLRRRTRSDLCGGTAR